MNNYKFEDLINRISDGVLTLFFTGTSILWWALILIPVLLFAFLNKQKNKSLSTLRELHKKSHTKFNRKLIWQEYKETAKFIKPGNKALDLGAGFGLLGEAIKKYCSVNVILCDVGDFNQTKLPLVLYDGNKLPFKDKEFDIVLLKHVLHHCQDPKAVLLEAKRVCSNKVIIYEDNSEGTISKIATKLHKLVFNWLFQAETSGSFFSQKQWQELFINLGFRISISRTNWIFASITYPIKRCFFVLDV